MRNVYQSIHTSEIMHWRGFELAPEPSDADAAWRFDSDDYYIAVTREDDGSFSACVEVLYIEGGGEGKTAAEALDAALRDVLDGAIRTRAACEELLARTR